MTSPRSLRSPVTNPADNLLQAHLGLMPGDSRLVNVQVWIFPHWVIAFRSYQSNSRRRFDRDGEVALVIGKADDIRRKLDALAECINAMKTKFTHKHLRCMKVGMIAKYSNRIIFGIRMLFVTGIFYDTIRTCGHYEVWV